MEKQSATIIVLADWRKRKRTSEVELGRLSHRLAQRRKRRRPPSFFNEPWVLGSRK
jgi:hypothetical protein